MREEPSRVLHDRGGRRRLDLTRLTQSLTDEGECKEGGLQALDRDIGKGARTG